MIFSDVSLKLEIHRQLVQVIGNFLISLGYKPTKRRHDNIMPPLWFKDVGSRIDVIEFMWETYKRPSFVINFRSYANIDDLESLRKNASKINVNEFYFMAFMTEDTHKSFRIGVFKRFFYVKKGISCVLNSCRLRIIEVYNFFQYGNSSTYFSESIQWQLVDNMKISGELERYKHPDSLYYLPPRRLKA
jgi:hypothetical protein